MDSLFDYIAFFSAVLLIILILLQTRGASLGAGLGGGGEGGGSVRRGSERSVHQITVVLVVIFAASLIGGFFI